MCGNAGGAGYQCMWVGKVNLIGGRLGRFQWPNRYESKEISWVRCLICFVLAPLRDSLKKSRQMILEVGVKQCRATMNFGSACQGKTSLICFHVVRLKQAVRGMEWRGRSLNPSCTYVSCRDRYLVMVSTTVDRRPNYSSNPFSLKVAKGT